MVDLVRCTLQSPHPSLTPHASRRSLRHGSRLAVIIAAVWATVLRSSRCSDSRRYRFLIAMIRLVFTENGRAGIYSRICFSAVIQGFNSTEDLGRFYHNNTIFSSFYFFMADGIHHKLLKVLHRHVAFTIPDTLRELFRNLEGSSQPYKALNTLYKGENMVNTTEQKVYKNRKCCCIYGYWIKN